MASFRSSGDNSSPGASGIARRPDSGRQVRIRVLIAMSSGLERMAWGLIVHSQRDMQLVAEVSSCREALGLLRKHPSDVTLIDESMLTANDYDALLEYAAQPLSSRFVLVAPHLAEFPLEQSKYSFMHAYLLKGVPADELLNAIRRTACVYSVDSGVNN